MPDGQTNASSPQVLIVVRFPAIAEMLGDLLSRVYPGAQIVVHEHFQSAVRLLERVGFTIVVVDIYSCNGDVGALETICAQGGAARKIFLDLEYDPRMSGLVRLMGADAYVPWTMSTRSIESIIWGVKAGAPYFEADRAAGAVHQEPDKTLLTPRQIEVHRLLERGASNKDIAQSLGLAPATVKIHVNAILKTLKVRNRTEAAVYFQMKQNLCRACNRVQIPGAGGSRSGPLSAEGAL
jgi:DNA-binding NarL/FixJ family response regulator